MATKSRLSTILERYIAQIDFHGDISCRSHRSRSMERERKREGRERETTKATDRAPLLDRVYLTSLPRALLSNSCGDSPSSKTFNLTFSAWKTAFNPRRISAKEVTLALPLLKTQVIRDDESAGWGGQSRTKEGNFLFLYFLASTQEDTLLDLVDTFALIFN